MNYGVKILSRASESYLLNYKRKYVFISIGISKYLKNLYTYVVGNT